MSQFKDHFSGHAASYTQYRPSYPPGLFAWLAGLTAGHQQAWDCATGGGQAAQHLTAYYKEVIATDASAQQIASATPYPHVRYAVASAEESGLPQASVDLVVVAQAAHWFDLPRFYAEVVRVATPGAVLALIGYGLFEIAPELDALVASYYEDTVGQDWPPERSHLVHAYTTLSFPFAEQDVPAFAMTATWTASQVLGYLGTWSATQGYLRRTGVDPMVDFSKSFLAAWPGSPEQPLAVRWPLFVRAARVDSFHGAGCSEGTGR